MLKGGVIESELVCSLVLVFILLPVVYYDFIYYKIPNFVPISLFGLYILTKISTGFPVPLLPYVLTIGVLWGFFFVAYFFRIIGGGDAKLFMALLPWMYEAGLQNFFLWTSLSGLCLALIYLVTPLRLKIFEIRWSIVSSYRSVLDKEKFLKLGICEIQKDGKTKKKIGVPYGLAIFSGVFITLVQKWGSL